VKITKELYLEAEKDRKWSNYRTALIFYNIKNYPR
jgi:hypothetical protein